MRTVSRRTFFKASGSALGALPLVRSIDSLAQITNPIFRHGVASGDPLADRVILWTRVTPQGTPASVLVRWTVATDPAISQIVMTGTTSAVPASDYTVKIDAVGLLPGHTYYYQFNAVGWASPVGRMKTLPVG